MVMMILETWGKFFKNNLKGEKYMFSKTLLLTGWALMLSLSALAVEANAQDRTKITIGTVGQSASCTGVETDCVDVVWQVTNPSPLIGGFEVTVKVFYSEAGSQTDSLTVRGGGARKAKVPVFHGGSGSLKNYEVTVRAFHRLATNTTIATATRTGTF